jgi:hypothetical protein
VTSRRREELSDETQKKGTGTQDRKESGTREERVGRKIEESGTRGGRE